MPMRQHGIGVGLKLTSQRGDNLSSPYLAPSADQSIAEMYGNSWAMN